MNDVSRAMLLIKSLDNDAHLRFSEWTQCWYVAAKVEVSNGVTLVGITEHRLSPDYAVHAFLSALQSVAHPEVLVTAAYTDHRRHWRWNGAAFTEQALEATA